MSIKHLELKTQEDYDHIQRMLETPGAFYGNHPGSYGVPGEGNLTLLAEAAAEAFIHLTRWYDITAVRKAHEADAILVTLRVKVKS